MYRFQVRAVTQPGEAIALVGSIPEMGLWDETRCIRLNPQGNGSSLWVVDLDLTDSLIDTGGDRARPTAIEYKYVRLRDQRVDWEAWGTNRWVPLEAEPLPSRIIVEDGWLGHIPPEPYGYFADPIPQPPRSPDRNGLKVVVVGSSVALGCSAWLLRGWAWHLEQALQQQYGHQLVNVSELGANVGSTIARFSQVVAPEKPDIVIIALSLGNEGLAVSAPHHRRAIQRRFENGLQQLINMTRDLGAQPILGGVYPNGDYAPEHYGLLQETHQRSLSWGVPVLDWLAAVDDGQGRWQAGTAFDAAHPNTRGHRQMYEAIDLTLFHPSQIQRQTQQPIPIEAVPIYRDDWGFHSFVCPAEHSLRIINTTPHPYTISPTWHELQLAVQSAYLPAGLYMAESTTANTVFSFFVQDDGTIKTTLTIPATADLTFYPVFHFFAPQRAQILFYDGHLGILKVSDRGLYITNDSDHDYNIQPMWKDMRTLLKTMPAGVYEDLGHPDAPFRTMMIGPDGLESRVKAPAQSAIALNYKCPLSDISRIAILPLGDRCGARMLLYKLEYDGPAFPFDLTRTTNLADVADMIHSEFQDMWHPSYLHYDPDARRIYHTKWTGLSFAHEIEDSDDPAQDLSPVYERMRVRYSARAQRFWYTLQHCDKVLFVRTGVCDRPTVIDLVQKLEQKSQGKPFRLLLISSQASDEFANLPNVLHYNLEFNPDRMYSDLSYWLECTEIMREILNSLGISSKNLFWCPPNLPPTPHPN